jgi:hypothetical protein
MPRIVPSEVLQVLESLYPWTKEHPEPNEALGADPSHGGDQIVQYGTILALAESIPPELHPRQSGDAPAFLAAIGALRAAVAMWANVPSWTLPNALFFRGRQHGRQHPLKLLADVLRRCPDQAPVQATAALPFLGDSDKREAIRQDMSSAEHALSIGEFKAAAVLAGAALEALLLWGVEHFDEPARKLAATNWETATKAPGYTGPQFETRTRNKPPDRWHLLGLTEVGWHLDVIDDSTRNMAREANDARNLIHPGRVQRGDAYVTKSAALQGLAAMERVAEHLARWRPPAQ